jgi:hypothetical protein
VGTISPVNRCLQDLKHLPNNFFDATIKNAEKCRPVLEPALQVSQESKVILSNQCSSRVERDA